MRDYNPWVWEANNKGRITRSNNVCLRLLGIDPPLGRQYTTLISKAEREDFKNLLEEEREGVYQVPHLHENGEEIVLEVRLTRMTTERDSIVIHGATALPAKQTDKSTNTILAPFQDNPVPMFVINHRREIQQWNASAAALIGCAEEDLTHAPLDKMLGVSSTALSRTSHNLQLQPSQRNDGIWADVVVDAPSEDKPGTVIIHDITPKQRMELVLRDSTNRLRNFFRMLRQPILSWKVTTPLPVAGAAQTIADHLLNIPNVCVESNDAAAEAFDFPNAKAMLGTPMSRLLYSLPTLHNMLTEWAEKDFFFQNEALLGDTNYEVTLIGIIEETHLQAVWLLGRNASADQQRQINLQRAIRKARWLVERSMDGFFEVNTRGTLLSVNPALCKMLLTHRNALIGQSLVTLCADPAANTLQKQMKRIQELDHLRLQTRFHRQDGIAIDVEISLNRNHAEGDETIYGFCQDITERKRNEKQILHLAERDQLTNLYNRYRFDEELNNIIARAHRSGEVFALIYIDLDNFKPINDNFGHHVGDQVLIAVANQIKGQIRNSDFPARLGGDEFGVILPNTNESNSLVVAENLLREIGNYEIEEDIPVRSSPSMGIALFPEHGDDREALVQAADQAMYQAKRGGKNRYVLSGEEF